MPRINNSEGPSRLCPQEISAYEQNKCLRSPSFYCLIPKPTKKASEGSPGWPLRAWRSPRAGWVLAHTQHTARRPGDQVSVLSLTCCVTLGQSSPFSESVALYAVVRGQEGVQGFLQRRCSQSSGPKKAASLTRLTLDSGWVYPPLGLSRKRFPALPSKAGSDPGRWTGSPAWLPLYTGYTDLFSLAQTRHSSSPLGPLPDDTDLEPGPLTGLSAPAVTAPMSWANQSLVGAWGSCN